MWLSYPLSVYRPVVQKNSPIESRIMANDNQKTLTGRSVFSVELTPEGVMVKTRFLTEDGKLMDMPAIFPSPDYALAQIDELRLLVSQKFGEAVKMSGQAQVDATQIISDLQKKSWAKYQASIRPIKKPL